MHLLMNVIVLGTQLKEVWDHGRLWKVLQDTSDAASCRCTRNNRADPVPSLSAM